MSFTIGSLFDGSGGFPLAAFMCGGVPTWASEIEPYPIAVTKTRFPYMKHLGSVTNIKGNEIEPVDVITFGSPCQDLSVAGKRAGLKHTDNGDEETTRSGLFMEAVRIIKEMREATNGVYPRIALWENVPGAFSSNKGEDFRVVLEEFIKIVEPAAVMPTVPKSGWPYFDHYCGDGWSLAYRTLDSQYWGVPQRRKRIYLVLDLGGQCAGEISFKRDGLRGYFAEGRAPWEGLAGDAERSAGTADCKGDCVAYSFDSLASNSMKSRNPHSGCRQVEVAKTLDCFDPNPSKNQGGIAVLEPVYIGNFLPQKKAESMAWSTEDVSGTLHNGACAGFQNGVVLKAVDTHILDDQGGSSISVRSDGKCPTLRAEAHGNIPCVLGFDMYNQQSTGGVSRTLKTPVGGDDLPVVCYDARGNGDGSTVSTITGDHNNRVTDYTSLVCEPTVCLEGNGNRPSHSGNGWIESDVMYTLNTIERHAVAYGIGNGQANQSFMEERTGALNCMHDQQAVCYGVDCRNFTEQPELYPTLQAKSNGGQSLNYSGAVRTQYIVRRLTPTECSRLQGFPDFWGHPDTKTEFTDEEYEFWLNVRNTHAEINGKAVNSYTKDQMLNWYNKLHTDSSEYKLWGNGIALPTALYMMQGIADVFK